MFFFLIKSNSSSVSFFGLVWLSQMHLQMFEKGRETVVKWLYGKELVHNFIDGCFLVAGTGDDVLVVAAYIATQN